MKSSGNEEFWRLYQRLPESVRAQSRQAYRLSSAIPIIPACVSKSSTVQDGPRNFWSVRFGGGYRAVCERKGENVEWLWVGTRQEFGKTF